MAVIEREPRSGTAVAETDTELVGIDKRRFWFLVQETPYFAEIVDARHGRRLRRETARGSANAAPCAIRILRKAREAVGCAEDVGFAAAGLGCGAGGSRRQLRARVVGSGGPSATLTVQLVPGAVSAGEPALAIATFRNLSRVTLPRARVTLHFPNALTVISAPDCGKVDARRPGTCVCGFGDVPSGGSAQASVSARLAAHLTQNQSIRVTFALRVGPGHAGADPDRRLGQGARLDRRGQPRELPGGAFDADRPLRAAGHLAARAALVPTRASSCPALRLRSASTRPRRARSTTRGSRTSTSRSSRSPRS